MKIDKNILVLTYWSFNDALIQTYTLPYVKIIADIISEDSKLYLYTLENKKTTTHTITKKISNITGVYHPFGLKAIISWLVNFCKLYILIKKNKINYIHCWCTPAGAAGQVLSKLTGAKLILDSYEPHAEAMIENGEWTKNSISFKLLFWLEKLQTKRASVVIAATKGMKGYAFRKYNTDLTNFHIKPACVNLMNFNLTNRKNVSLVKSLNYENKIVCVYAGKFGGIYLKDEVFEFYKIAYDFWKDKFRILILTNQSNIELLDLADKYLIPHEIITIKFVKHSEIADYIGLGDFAICPVKPVATKKFCTPIKNGEYWALGLPIIMPSEISDDSEIIKKTGNGFVFKELNKDEYLKSIHYIQEYFEKYNSDEIFFKNRALAEKYRKFSIAEEVYRKIYFSN